MDILSVELGRQVNVVLGLVGMGVLLRSYCRNRARYTTKALDVWWVMFTTCMVCVYGSIEILMNWDSSVRVFLVSFMIVLIIRSQLRRGPYFKDSDDGQ